MSVNAFHEKAGRSQVNSCCSFVKQSLLSRRVATVAMLPSALSRSDSFRSVHVGRSRFSRCCHLIVALMVLLFPSRTWARRLTQSPELGFGFCLFSSWNGFDFCFVFLFYAATATVVRLLLCNGSYASPLTHR
jgi:hypothetical protein